MILYLYAQQKVIPEHESLKTQQKSSAAKLPAPDQIVLKKLQDEMRKLSKASSAVCDTAYAYSYMDSCILATNLAYFSV